MVRVRAQVMMRDDSTGGWVPVGGGGLSNVSVQKQKIFHEDEDQLCKHEYLIDGKRISDQAVSIILFFREINFTKNFVKSISYGQDHVHIK